VSIDIRFPVSIYVLLDPETHAVRYVGQTIYSLETRLSGHIADAVRAQKHGRLCPRHRWILSLRERGLKPLIEEVEQVHQRQRGDGRRAEREWIAGYLALGADLVNICSNPKELPEYTARHRAAMLAGMRRARRAKRARDARIAKFTSRTAVAS
jgi:hypothetical protein